MADKLKTIVNALEDKKAEDISILRLQSLTAITDYFVICTGTNPPQIKAIADNVERRLRDSGVKPLGIEGLRGAQWVLMDYNDVLIHVFTPQMRDYYQLERLWLDAPSMTAQELRAS
ncbi:MAG: ribosome silencing factor [Magnetococcales bacterium]|uniref:Ribosomal silencing factor RsfS n=1 Tax=Candidatus Magnetobacterium casense TaxID=1455061 RepID=A0ABS6S134_9BACT|nr:ribosome silencing factor [Nitrospirota bacterium]MBV6342521.1 ribosome silencing factor [Candidatus Magnetobacterium casensis]